MHMLRESMIMEMRSCVDVMTAHSMASASTMVASAPMVTSCSVVTTAVRLRLGRKDPRVDAGEQKRKQEMGNDAFHVVLLSHDQAVGRKMQENSIHSRVCRLRLK